MKYSLPVLYLIFAAFGLYMAITAREFYGGLLGRKAKGRPIPNWLGRLWFLVFSVSAAYMGIKDLLALRH
jgi:hypothetical protein